MDETAMHRFYLPPGENRGPLLTLTGAEAHHALRVLRIRRGDRVSVLDGAGQESHCEVSETDKRELTLQVLETKTIPSAPCAITLLQAIPKGKIIESIIQKATELGVARIVPLLTGRVATHLDAAAAKKKSETWQQVAIEATKQCGNAWLPNVELPARPREVLDRRESFELSLVASLHDEPRHVRSHFDRFVSEHQRLPRSIAMWIGPEGDFTPAEVQSIKAAGALPISLGRLVLRVETAATYCLAVLNHELAWPRVEPSVWR